MLANKNILYRTSASNSGNDNKNSDILHHYLYNYPNDGFKFPTAAV